MVTSSSSDAEGAPIRPDGGREGLSDRSGDWLLARSRELSTVAQFGQVEEQPAAITEMEALLAEVRHRSDKPLFLRMLMGTAGTLVGSPGAGYRADHLINELLDYAREHGLWLHEVACWGLLAWQEVVAGREDDALTHAATALSALEQGGERYSWCSESVWHYTQAVILSSVGLVLAQLGVFEQADPLLERVQAQYEADGDNPHGLTVSTINRVGVLLGWGLRLERAAEWTEAAERLAAAAALASAVEHPWRSSLYPQRDRPAAEQDPIVAAAHALADPDPRHIPVLREMLTRNNPIWAPTLVAIALARCLDRDDRTPEALRTLREISGQMVGDSSQPALALSLAHEIARLSGSAEDAMAYAAALEAELWAVHKARMATVRTRIEHDQIDRQHTQAARLARQDPLTGLPNRRALLETLEAAATEPRWAPIAVALIDLDGFKEVNDRQSHVHGDEVLRKVASTLQNAMREDDVVTRYGGDEFVVLLRRTTLAAAEVAMGRAGRAIAALPVARAGGVTASVGVTALRPGDSTDAVLSRADAAMYQVKREGGNRVLATDS